MNPLCTSACYVGRALLVLALALPATAAWASPWTLQRGQVVFQGRYDYESATEEFKDTRGDAEVFPLAGEYRASTYTFGARVGLTDALEVEVSLPIKLVTYSSDPVILLEDPSGDASQLDYYQENVIDLTRSRAGLGDLTLAGRYQLVGGRFAMALGVELRTPTGYDGPAGTFGDRPKSREDFVARVGELVRPENVTDDVTLGDGAFEIRPRVLVGYAAASGTFARLDAGYDLRLGGAGDQLASGARVGQLLGKRVVVYGGADLELNVTDGDVIGVSVAAVDPALPASEYGGVENLDLREVRLEKDRLSVPAGVLVRITPQIELNLAYAITPWGRNTAMSQGFSVGVAILTSLPEGDGS